MARGDTPVWWLNQQKSAPGYGISPASDGTGGGINGQSGPKYAGYAFGIPSGDGIRLGPQQELGKSYSGDTKGGPEKPKDEMALILEQIRKFYEEMNAPFDPNSPEFKPIMDAIRQSTLSSSQMAGVYGPYSQNQAEQAYARGAAQFAGQRKSQALQALGLLAGATGAQYDRQYAHDLDKWQQQTQKDSDLWRLGGGVLGGIGGAIAGGIVGNVPGAIAGATGGWSLGSNLGGAIGGATQKPLPNMPMTFGGY